MSVEPREACLDEQTAIDLVSGWLPESEALILRAHVATCDSCFEIVTVAMADEPSFPQIGTAVPDAGRSVEPGAVIAGYTIQAKIGEGAAGTVYRAERAEPVGAPTVVAIKIFKAGSSVPSLGARSPDAEARVALQVQSQWVCGVLAMPHVDEQGRLVLVLELASRSLYWELEHDWGARSLGERIEAGLSVSRGLSAVHAAGFLHRDLKPENVLRMPNGRLVISDFGLATRPLEETGAARAVGVGTRRYMAPEQRDTPATVASDIYALGMVLHQVFFGVAARRDHATLAFEPDRAGAITRTERELLALCSECLSLDSTARPRAASAVVARLERTLQSARGTDFWQGQRRLALLAKAAAAALACTLAAVLSVRWPKTHIQVRTTSVSQPSSSIGALKIDTQPPAHPMVARPPVSDDSSTVPQASSAAAQASSAAAQASSSAPLVEPTSSATSARSLPDGTVSGSGELEIELSARIPASVSYCPSREARSKISGLPPPRAKAQGLVGTFWHSNGGLCFELLPDGVLIAYAAHWWSKVSRGTWLSSGAHIELKVPDSYHLSSVNLGGRVEGDAIVAEDLENGSKLLLARTRLQTTKQTGCSTATIVDINVSPQASQGVRRFDAKYVQSVVWAKQSEIDRCFRSSRYELVPHELSRWHLQYDANGEVTAARWRPTGSVLDVAELPAPRELEACLLPVLRSLRFGSTLPTSGEDEVARFGLGSQKHSSQLSRTAPRCNE